MNKRSDARKAPIGVGMLALSVGIFLSEQNLSQARPGVFLLARAALALSEGRPLWVYVVRQPMGLAMRAAALLYDAKDFWNEAARPVIKRGRRAVWRAWYESSQQLSRRWQRSKKRLLRLARGVRPSIR